MSNNAQQSYTVLAVGCNTSQKRPVSRVCSSSQGLDHIWSMQLEIKHLTFGLGERCLAR